jgi:chemotaxis signal transduction protein
VEETALHRALKTAPDRPTEQNRFPDAEFFVFRLAAYNFASSSSAITEVTRYLARTPLPQVPSFVLGAVAHHGAVNPLIDLLRFFGQGEVRPQKNDRIVMAQAQATKVAFLANEVVGIERISAMNILEAPLSGALSREFLMGMVMHAKLGTIHLIDLAKIVQSAKLKVSAK